MPWANTPQDSGRSPSGEIFVLISFCQIEKPSSIKRGLTRLQMMAVTREGGGCHWGTRQMPGAWFGLPDTGYRIPGAGYQVPDARGRGAVIFKILEGFNQNSPACNAGVWRWVVPALKGFNWRWDVSKNCWRWTKLYVRTIIVIATWPYSFYPPSFLDHPDFAVADGDNIKSSGEIVYVETVLTNYWWKSFHYNAGRIQIIYWNPQTPF